MDVARWRRAKATAAAAAAAAAGTVEVARVMGGCRPIRSPRRTGAAKDPSFGTSPLYARFFLPWEVWIFFFLF